MTLQLLAASELTPNNEAVIYKQHAQLFRWREGEWKERGTGEIMLLRHAEHGTVRFLMWQGRTCKTIAKFDLVETSSSCHLCRHEDDPTTWEWTCVDQSDDCSKEERFVACFATEALAAQFQTAFTMNADCDDLKVVQADGGTQTCGRQPCPNIEEALINAAEDGAIPSAKFECQVASKSFGDVNCASSNSEWSLVESVAKLWV
jgi:hypothetical protein